MLVTQLYLNFCYPMDCGLFPWNSPGKDTGAGSHSLPQLIEEVTPKDRVGFLSLKTIIWTTGNIVLASVWSNIVALLSLYSLNIALQNALRIF